MPGAQERVLRRRIASVQNTKKITRAMELIAATRVVKAQQRAKAARPYSEHITQVIQDLAAGGAAVDHPLLRQAESIQRLGIVVISSDRGLAGAFNASVIRAAEREIQAARAAGQQYSLVCVGKKAIGYFKFRNYEIAAEFQGMSDTLTFDDAREVAREVGRQFTEGGVDRILLAYTKFITMGTQEVAVRRFLPLEQIETIGEVGDATAKADFEFEPSPAGVLTALLPRYVESRLYAAMLDSSASEHASRQRAMKAATDNAQEMILKLSRKMNQARQDAITTEIMEIIGGAEALSDDKGDQDDLLLDHLSFEHVARRHSGIHITN